MVSKNKFEPTPMVLRLGDPTPLIYITIMREIFFGGPDIPRPLRPTIDGPIKRPTKKTSTTTKRKEMTIGDDDTITYPEITVTEEEILEDTNSDGNHNKRTRRWTRKSKDGKVLSEISVVEEDTNGDGKIDKKTGGFRYHHYPKGGDPFVEKHKTTYYDRDGDGKFEETISEIDLDGDGKIDSRSRHIHIDKDGDGIFETLRIDVDTNLDGEWDFGVTASYG